jgi:hypothetical protein
MRKILYVVLSSTALLAGVPATALAHHHRHHHRIRHEQFGSERGQPLAPAEDQTAGTVMSFAGGVLTIRLNDGSTVSGSVTGATELKCEAPGQENLPNQDSGTSGDNEGDHSNTSGDQGDDNGENEAEQMCTTPALTQGTVVQDADLQISSAGAIWREVELVTP